MKTSSLIYAIATAWLMVSCSKPLPPQAEPTPTPAPKANQTPTPLPTPTPSPTPTPITHHFAPAGTYFLTQRASINTDSGITGVAVGTKVTVLKDEGNTLYVTDGTNSFDVSRAQVTNDLDILSAAGQVEAEKQKALAIWNQQQKQAAQRQTEAKIQFLNSENQKQLNKQQIQTLQNQYTSLKEQEGNLRRQIAHDRDMRYTHHAQIHDAIPGIGTIENLESQLSGVLQSEQDVNSQILNLQK